MCSKVIPILLYFHSVFFILSYLTLTPQMWYSVPQISQREHLQYSKLLLILHYASKINLSERQEDMLGFFLQKTSAFLDSHPVAQKKIYGLECVICKRL